VEPEFLDEGKSTQRYLGKRFFLLIYLDRSDVPNREGSGLFLILKRSSYLNFKKKFVLSVYKI
jgi:hypothetical protein